MLAGLPSRCATSPSSLRHVAQPRPASRAPRPARSLSDNFTAQQPLPAPSALTAQRHQHHGATSRPRPAAPTVASRRNVASAPNGGPGLPHAHAPVVHRCPTQPHTTTLRAQPRHPSAPSAPAAQHCRQQSCHGTTSRPRPAAPAVQCCPTHMRQQSSAAPRNRTRPLSAPSRAIQPRPARQWLSTTNPRDAHKPQGAPSRAPRPHQPRAAPAVPAADHLTTAPQRHSLPHCCAT